MFERPDGVKMASFFIAAIMVVSFLSRISRAFEPRVGVRRISTSLGTDSSATAREGPIPFVANEPRYVGDGAAYRNKVRQSSRRTTCRTPAT